MVNPTTLSVSDTIECAVAMTSPFPQRMVVLHPPIIGAFALYACGVGCKEAP